MPTVMALNFLVLTKTCTNLIWHPSASGQCRVAKAIGLTTISHSQNEFIIVLDCGLRA